jgi:hypothetical protein
MMHGASTMSTKHPSSTSEVALHPHAELVAASEALRTRDAQIDELLRKSELMAAHLQLVPVLEVTSLQSSA